MQHTLRRAFTFAAFLPTGSSDNILLWQHSPRYIRECVRKNKPIDYFVYPEHPHHVQRRDRVHLFEKIDQFFKDNLQSATDRETQILIALSAQ